MGIIETFLRKLGCLKEEKPKPDIRYADPSHAIGVKKAEQKSTLDEDEDNGSGGDSSYNGYRRRKPVPEQYPRPKWGNRKPRR